MIAFGRALFSLQLPEAWICCVLENPFAQLYAHAGLDVAATLMSNCTFGLVVLADLSFFVLIEHLTHDP